MVQPAYQYKFGISSEALRTLDSLDKTQRRHIGYAMHGLQLDFRGDVKKLRGHADLYRLRVGNFRVFFRLRGNQIQVYEIRDKKDAYGN
jgi:mRNA-degrading endonuclease RelE of RelBE toxin-antitoxin system